MNNLRRLAIGLLAASSAAVVSAEPLPTVTFEQFSQGSPNGQYGWKSTGSDGPSCAGQPYDHQVAPNMTRFSSFGRQSLRISNAVTSQCLRDQTFSAPVINEAGERRAYTDVPSGVRQPFFVFEFDFASTPPGPPGTPQPELQMAVSADKGDGGRMSWVEIADFGTGLEITFAEYQDNPPYGSQSNPAAGRGPEDGFFYTTVAAGLDRAAKHRLRIEHSFYEGPRNDVVIVKVDGDDFVHRGTSWEDYYRWQQGPGDPQQTAPVRESRVVRSILFQTRNTPAPNTLGFGFEFDNVKQASGPIPSGQTPDKTDCKHGRGHGRRGHHPDNHHHGDNDHGHGRGGHDCRHDRDDDHDHGHGRGGHDCRNDRDDDHDRGHGRGDHDDHDGRGNDHDRGHGRDDDRGHDRGDNRDRHNDWDNDRDRHESQHGRDRGDGRGR